jgi:sugar phosphate isomerase/epimerase
LKNISKNISRRRFIERTIGLGGAAFALGMGVVRCARGQNWQVGCYTRPWGDHDYRVALDEISQAGFRHVGLMTTKSETRLVISGATTPDEARKIGEEVKKRGLSVASVWGGDIPVRESLEAGIEWLRKLVDHCVACESKTLLLGGTGNEELYDAYYKAVAECCDYAAERSIGLVIKPHGGLNATGAQCRGIIEKVNHPNFRMWYDPGNILYYSDGELDPVDDAADVDGLVVGMCVKDYLHPREVMVTPGTGLVDFPQVMSRLKRGGFKGGPLIIECLKQGDLPQLRQEAVQARRFVEELVG